MNPRKTSVLCLALAALIACAPAYAQSRVATTAAQFLTIGTGARASALGHAYTAHATGGEALYWNPAGAARAYDSYSRGSIFVSHADWLMDIDYNAFGFVVPVTASGVLGISIAQMNYGRMDVTSVDLPDGTGESFGAADLVVGVSYAQPLTNSFYIGGTLKYVRQSIYDMSASTGALDVGFVLESEYLNGMRLAASIMNFGAKMQMDGINSRLFVDIDPGNSGSNDKLPATLETEAWPLPLSFKFGASVPVVNTHSARLELLADAHQTNDNELNADLGALLRYTVGTVNFELRGGYKDMAVSNATSHVTLGGGVDLRAGGIRLGADYGFVPYNEIGNVQMVDFRLYF